MKTTHAGSLTSLLALQTLFLQLPHALLTFPAPASASFAGTPWGCLWGQTPTPSRFHHLQPQRNLVVHFLCSYFSCKPFWILFVCILDTPRVERMCALSTTEMMLITEPNTKHVLVTLPGYVMNKWKWKQHWLVLLIYGICFTRDNIS